METIRKHGKDRFEWKDFTGKMYLQTRYGSKARVHYECKVKLESVDLTASVFIVAEQSRLLTLLKAGCKRNCKNIFVFRPETEAEKANPYNITVFIYAAKASKDGI